MEPSRELKLKIVFVQLFDLPSTMAHTAQIVSTACALARRGHEVVLHPRMPRGTEPEAELGRLFGIAPPPSLRIDPVRWQHKGLGGLSFRIRLLRHLRGSDESTVFYCRQRRQALQLLGMRRLLGGRARIVYEFHNIEHKIAEESKSERAARTRIEELRLFADADGISAISQPLADDLAELAPTRTPIEVIPDGVELEFFRGLGRDVLAASRREVRLVYAGSLYPHKGVDVLVEAMALLPARVELSIIGNNGPRDRARLEALARSLPRGGERVRFAGQVAPREVPDHLSRADLILLPVGEEVRATRYTSPLKLFEAMATGIPIIAANAPSLASVLVAEHTALVVETNDATGWARAVERALADPERARALGRAAMQAAEDYGWNRRAERIELFLAKAGAANAAS